MGADPTEVGGIRNNAGVIRARDSIGVFDPRYGYQSVPESRLVNAGDGLVGGGDLTADRTFNVVAADGSINVGPNAISVGVISDAQHGSRGGGALHALATTMAPGFMSAADKTALDNLGFFGQEFQYITSIPISSTSSNVFQNKLTLATTSLPAGNYILLFSYVVGGTANNTVVESRVILDAVDVRFIVNQRIGTANGRFSVGGHEVVAGLTAGVHTFSIEYRKSSGSGNASIEGAHLTLWRIN